MICTEPEATLSTSGRRDLGFCFFFFKKGLRCKMVNLIRLVSLINRETENKKKTLFTYIFTIWLTHCIWVCFIFVFFLIFYTNVGTYNPFYHGHIKSKFSQFLTPSTPKMVRLVILFRSLPLSAFRLEFFVHVRALPVLSCVDLHRVLNMIRWLIQM